MVASMFCLATASCAAQCSATIETDDAMRFIPDHVEVAASCAEFTVNLTHVGRLPKAAMGHNWVLVQSADLAGVARTGMLAGASQDYIDPTDPRVIAHTGLIGRTESTSITFPVKKLLPNQTYAFLCTFAGHSPLMQGTLRLNTQN